MKPRMFSLSPTTLMMLFGPGAGSVVVLSDHAAGCDSAEWAHRGDSGLQMCSAHILEVNVDALRECGSYGLRHVARGLVFYASRDAFRRISWFFSFSTGTS